MRSDASRPGNLKLAADGADCAFLDFAVPRDRSDLAVSGIFPDRMIAAFACKKAVVDAEMALQIEPFQEAAS